MVTETRRGVVPRHGGAIDDAGEPVVGTARRRLSGGDDPQLEDVLRVCRSAVSLSAAGRVLFDCSRERKKIANDADRLRKYLARFDLDWSELKERLRQD